MRRVDATAEGFLGEALDPDEILVALKPSDLQGLRGALRETLNELEDWEFELHMGYTRAEIEALKTSLWEL